MASALITKLRVSNYETWKEGYDRGEPMRRDAGVRGVHLFRDATDPNLLSIVTRFDSVDAAKKMLASDEWKQATSKLAAPMEIFFNDIAEEKSY